MTLQKASSMHHNRKENKVSTNIEMLYIMNIVQLVLPLITLPYLTRVLSVDGYGVVSYVKSLIIYITLIIEFGYLLSGTREVAEANNKRQLGVIIGKITVAKLILSSLAFLTLLLMIRFIPLLHRHALFTILSFGSPFLSIFLFDYLFRGLERMQITTCRFLITKGISTVLTFLLIKSDQQLLLIPILDIIGSLAAVIWIGFEIKHLEIHIYPAKWRNVWQSLRESFVYFISDVAATAFGAFNTLIVGIYLSTESVAYWGLIITFIAAVQSMYMPISDGIYPRMIKQKSTKLLIRILAIFLPILLLGSVIGFFGAHLIMLIVGGSKYVGVAKYLQECIPLFILIFFELILGWPTLGALGKIKETTFTTIIGAIVQVAGVLIWVNVLSISLLIIIRTVSELIMVLLRGYYIFHFRYLFLE